MTEHNDYMDNIERIAANAAANVVSIYSDDGAFTIAIDSTGRASSYTNDLRGKILRITPLD